MLPLQAGTDTECSVMVPLGVFVSLLFFGVFCCCLVCFCWFLWLAWLVGYHLYQQSWDAWLLSLLRDMLVVGILCLSCAIHLFSFFALGVLVLLLSLCPSATTGVAHACPTPPVLLPSPSEHQAGDTP